MSPRRRYDPILGVVPMDLAEAVVVGYLKHRHDQLMTDETTQAATQEEIEQAREEDAVDRYATFALAAMKDRDVILVVDLGDYQMHIAAVPMGDDYVYPMMERKATESRVIRSEMGVRDRITENWPNVDLIPYERSAFA